MKKSCSKCGVELQYKQQFCPNCGIAYVPEQKKKVKTPLTLLKKAFISVALLLIVIVVSGHFYMKQSTSSDYTIQRMYNSLMNDDVDHSITSWSYRKAIHQTEKNLYDTLKEQDLDKFLDVLNVNAATVYKDGLTKIISHEDGHEIFRMRQGKKLGIYPFVQVVKAEGTGVEDALNDESRPVGNFKVIEKGKKSVPVEKLKSQAIYTATMQNGKSVSNLYVVALDTTIEELEFSSAFGQESERHYTGNYAFFLAEVDGKNGFLQEDSPLATNKLSLVNNNFHSRNTNWGTRRLSV